MISFSKHTTLIQDEVASIYHCVKEVEKWIGLGKGDLSDNLFSVLQVLALN